MKTAPPIAIFAPSLVVAVTIEGRREEPVEIHFHPGGQGFWVARMAACLGARPVLCAPLGGEVGAVLGPLIEAYRIDLRTLQMAGDNGIYVHDRRSGERRVLAEAESGTLSRHELDDLYNLFVTAAIASGTAVLTGPSPPRVASTHVYDRLVHDLAMNGVPIVADLSGPYLRALGKGTRLLKVAHDELVEAGYAKDATLPELARGVLELRDQGIEWVICSRAEHPALAWFDGRFLELRGPRFDAMDHRGAGDSMTAALAVALARGLPADEMLRLAAAAGSLNTTRHGLGSGLRESIETLAERIELRELPGLDRDRGGDSHA